MYLRRVIASLVLGICFSAPAAAGPACGPGMGQHGLPGLMRYGHSGMPMGRDTHVDTREVIDILNEYLKTQPGLRAGRLMVKGDYWEAEVLDARGRLVQKLLIDPRSGYFFYQK